MLSNIIEMPNISMDENNYINQMDELNKLRKEVKYLKDLNNQKNKENISDEKLLKEEEKKICHFSY